MITLTQEGESISCTCVNPGCPCKTSQDSCKMSQDSCTMSQNSCTIRISKQRQGEVHSMMSLTAVTTRTSTVRSTTCHHAMFLLTRYMFTCSHLYTSILSTRSTYPQATGAWYSHLYTCKYTVNKVHISPGYRDMV